MNADALRGQVAVVTGAGRGIGRVVAETLAHAGIPVSVAARTKAQVDATAAAIEHAGGRALAVATDVTDEASVAHLVAETHRVLGPPTLLVNNAGVWTHVGPVWEGDAEAWWRDVEVSLRGAFLCTRAVLPSMLRRKQGRIVNTVSYAAIQARPYASGYASGKAALARLTDSLSLELEGTGIAVFALAPGFARTDLVEGVARSKMGRKFLPALAERDDVVPPERAASLILDIATGRLDPLSGRLLHALDDVDDLLRRSDEVRDRDLFVLRLQT